MPLFAASVLGRLPIGALSLALLLRTREMTGSYAAGGIVAGACGLATALGQPWLGRAVDRRGQTRVLLVAGTVNGLVLGAFAALPDATPLPVAVLIAAAAGGVQPPISSCLRALLSEAVAAKSRHRAFALDSTLFELVYITGPLVIIGVIGAWSLRAAVAACAALTIIGTVAFAATRLSRAAIGRPGAGTRLAGPLGGPGVRVLILSVFLFGLSIASLEVGLAAFADDEGARNAVGYLLALSGVGSMIGGVIAARAGASADPHRRLVGLLVVLAVLEVPLAVMPSLPAMGAAVGIAGLAIAPTLALTFQLASETAPGGTVTETMTWLTSAIAGGLALGSALAGTLAEEVGTTAVLAGVAFYTAIEAAVVARRT